MRVREAMRLKVASAQALGVVVEMFGEAVVADEGGEVFDVVEDGLAFCMRCLASRAPW